MLWFDVKLKRYSTLVSENWKERMLWFDVKLKRYSTSNNNEHNQN